MASGTAHIAINGLPLGISPGRSSFEAAAGVVDPGREKVRWTEGAQQHRITIDPSSE